MDQMLQNRIQSLLGDDSQPNLMTTEMPSDAEMKIFPRFQCCLSHKAEIWSRVRITEHWRPVLLALGAGKRSAKRR